MITGIQAGAQNAYDISTDEKTGQLIFRGPLSFDDLRQEPKFSWFDENLTGYTPEYHDMRYLADNLPQYSLVVFMGTWCDDSHYLIPKLYSLLNKMHFPVPRLTMYGVDRDKNALGAERERYNITKVPTIILFRDNKEAGRITESVIKSLESDLAGIIRQDIMDQNK